MKKLMLIMLLFISSASLASANPAADTEELVWNRQAIRELRKSGIPVFIPSRVPVSESPANLGKPQVSLVKTPFSGH